MIYAMGCQVFSDLAERARPDISPARYFSCAGESPRRGATVTLLGSERRGRGAVKVLRFLSVPNRTYGPFLRSGGPVRLRESLSNAPA